MKFLVMDNSATMQRIVVSALQRLGYTHVIEAGDGREARNAGAAIGFVTTHWKMPVMTGPGFVQDLCARGADGAAAPILMVTARSQREDILGAIAAGVYNYIVTPCTPQILRQKIDARNTRNAER